MIDNIINQIKETEKKAKEIAASSKKESTEIIEEAYREAAKILKEAEKEVKVMYIEAENKAKRDAGKEAARLEKDFDRRLAEIKDISKANQEKAIEKIIQRIVS
jgi:vacuolar-type H+-ATPase subunit H